MPVHNRTYLFTSLVSPASKQGLMRLTVASWQELLAVSPRAENYIGHEETANLLGLSAHRGEARPVAGDVAYVIHLKARLLRPRSHLGVVNPQDFEVLKVRYE